MAKLGESVVEVKYHGPRPKCTICGDDMEVKVTAFLEDGSASKVGTSGMLKKEDGDDDGPEPSPAG